MSSLRRSRGFTLIEILVALSILSVVSVMAYRGLASALDTTSRLEDERRFWKGLSLAYVRMDDDFRQARPRPIRSLEGPLKPAFSGQATAGRGAQMEFTRGVSGPADAPMGLQRVGYELKDGTLWRVSYPSVDRVSDADALRTSLVSGVEDLRLRFFGEAGQPQAEWPFRSTIDKLPRGVEVALRIAGRGEFTRTFLIHE